MSVNGTFKEILKYREESGAMQMNPMKLLQIKGLWEEFQRNHERFMQFVKVAGQGALSEGAGMEVTVTTAEGKTLSSNLKVTAQDMELVRQLREMVMENAK